jgi:hypothetical protein
MAPVREVYNYTNPIGDSARISLAPPSSNIGTTLTNTAEIQNNVNSLYDNKKNLVGKYIANRVVNTFEDKTTGYVNNRVYAFDDGSYVMTLEWSSGYKKPNTKYVYKAVSTGGKYAGKDVTVILKTDSDKGRKVIFEYDN